MVTWSHAYVMSSIGRLGFPWFSYADLDHPIVWWLKFCEPERAMITRIYEPSIIQGSPFFRWSWWNPLDLIWNLSGFGSYKIAMFVKCFLISVWTLVIVSWWDSFAFSGLVSIPESDERYERTFAGPPLSFLVTPPNKHVRNH